MITWTSHDDYLVPSEYAVSTQSDAPKSRKLPKTSFFAHFCIIYDNHARSIGQDMSDMMTESLETFC